MIISYENLIVAMRFRNGDLNNFSINGNSYMVCMLLNGVLGGRNISI